MCPLTTAPGEDCILALIPLPAAGEDCILALIPLPPLARIASSPCSH